MFRFSSVGFALLFRGSSFIKRCSMQSDEVYIRGGSVEILACHPDAVYTDTTTESGENEAIGRTVG